MKTEVLKLRYPSGFENAVHMTVEELEHQIRLMAALKMFELGKISSGKAAELAGLTRVEFFDACARYKVSVLNYPPEEIAREIREEVKAFDPDQAR